MHCFSASKINKIVPTRIEIIMEAIVCITFKHYFDCILYLAIARDKIVCTIMVSILKLDTNYGFHELFLKLQMHNKLKQNDLLKLEIFKYRTPQRCCNDWRARLECGRSWV